MRTRRAPGGIAGSDCRRCRLRAWELRWQVGHTHHLLFLLLFEMPLHDLKALIAAYDQPARDYAALTHDQSSAKEGYQLANRVLGPVLKRQGYRSLAQFERACEASDG